MTSTLLPLLKTVTGYTHYAWLIAELDSDPEDRDFPLIIREIPRQAEIPSPYAYSPTHCVYRHRGREVIIVEVAHRRYQMFDATGIPSADTP